VAPNVINHIGDFNVTDMKDIFDKNPVMSNMFMSKMVGNLSIIDEKGLAHDTGMSYPLIFMKMYNYAGKSQSTKWSEMSPM